MQVITLYTVYYSHIFCFIPQQSWIITGTKSHNYHHSTIMRILVMFTNAFAYLNDLTAEWRQVMLFYSRFNKARALLAAEWRRQNRWITESNEMRRNKRSFCTTIWGLTFLFFLLLLGLLTLMTNFKCSFLEAGWTDYTFGQLGTILPWGLHYEFQRKPGYNFTPIWLHCHDLLSHIQEIWFSMHWLKHIAILFLSSVTN